MIATVEEDVVGNTEYGGKFTKSQIVGDQFRRADNDFEVLAFAWHLLGLGESRKRTSKIVAYKLPHTIYSTCGYR